MRLFLVLGICAAFGETIQSGYDADVSKISQLKKMIADAQSKADAKKLATARENALAAVQIDLRNHKAAEATAATVAAVPTVEKESALPTPEAETPMFIAEEDVKPISPVLIAQNQLKSTMVAIAREKKALKTLMDTEANLQHLIRSKAQQLADHKTQLKQDSKTLLDTVARFNSKLSAADDEKPAPKLEPKTSLLEERQKAAELLKDKFKLASQDVEISHLKQQLLAMQAQVHPVKAPEMVTLGDHGAKINAAQEAQQHNELLEALHNELTSL
jgi:hypothetical protein